MPTAAEKTIERMRTTDFPQKELYAQIPQFTKLQIVAKDFSVSARNHWHFRGK
jgi:hypothetical protein